MREVNVTNILYFAAQTTGINQQRNRNTRVNSIPLRRVYILKHNYKNPSLKIIFNKKTL